MITKDRIDALFKKLRKQGLFARQDFQNTESTALYDIEQEKETRNADGTPKYRGYVFYHRVDNEYAFGEPILTPNGHIMGTTMINDLYLTFGSMNGDWNEAIHIGHEVCKTARDVGLVWKWDGDPEKKVIIRNKERNKK